MVDCYQPSACALLIEILGARCGRCYRQDPAVTAHIELHRAKAAGRQGKAKAPRRTWARGLRDAERARADAPANAPRRTVS